jgi:hypothetical protein
VHVLRQTNEALVPGGVLIDLHPTCVGSRIEARGRPLGRLEEGGAREEVVVAEAGLEQSIRLGFFVREAAVRRDVVERWDEPEEMLNEIAEWGGQSVPAAVQRRVRGTAGPIDLIERLVFQRLRAI